MIKTMLTVIIIFSSAVSYCQISGKRHEKPIKIYDSIEIKPGDTLHLGKGTDRRGDFVYIFQPPNYIIGIVEKSLPRNYANQRIIIKHFKNQTTKKFGEKFVAVVNPGGLNYSVDIESAIEAGEVIAINGRKFTKEPNDVKVVNKPETKSIADELKKLKELYDSGAITKEEYDAAKKKILDQ